MASDPQDPNDPHGEDHHVGLGSSSSSSSFFGSDDSRSTTSSGEIPPTEPCFGAVAWGSASTIGRRREMEDAVAVAPDFVSIPCCHVGGCAAELPSGDSSGLRFFGVYDGHGGSQVAKYCAERVHEVVAELWKKGSDGEGWQRRWEMAFSDGFERVDDEVIAEGVASDIVGSTALVVLVSGCQIISSNCGDSRAVLCRGDQTIQLTIDHKPDREDERTRIESEGGRVINWKGPRVLGVLAMSRSIGDRYMRPWIIPVPETSFLSRSSDDECLILASDGLWDVMSNQEVGEVASRLLKRHRQRSSANGTLSSPAQAVADHLVKLAHRKFSSDNISVIVVDLKSRSSNHL
ncbi:protein phosphatase 2C protein [Dioscorea alata]|uniref:Protein phosphatase 2C protein n=1 Tax=Dioscorea alata TaxID=55571 RepID=A0ACB7WEX7_DIOAL|nr:protein phosphatase 2C protein [Dioscorea alata]